MREGEGCALGIREKDCMWWESDVRQPQVQKTCIEGHCFVNIGCM